MNTAVVGKNIDSWCSRCKLMLAHTVEANVGSRITRVHCNTCGAQHAFRPRPAGQGVKGASTRAARTDAASRRPTVGGTTGTKDYRTLIQGRDASAARRFVVTERFKVGDLLSHPAFGLGIVTADREGNKIEVLFADGPKTLAHGR